MLLPIIGAGLGGMEAYRRTGGDIGATALGALGGAVVPAGLRMAGTALGGIGAGALGRTALGNLLKAQTAKSGASLLTQIPGATGGLAASLGTFLGAPAIAGALASKAAAPAQAATRAGAGVLGYQAPGDVDYAAAAGKALPDGIGTFGAGGTLSDPLQVLGPVGMAQRLEAMKTAETQRDALRMLMPEIAKASEFRSRQELQRQLAAAGVRQNIATSANMLERSQQAAQQMGLGAAQQIGSALTSQYQYQ